VNYLRTGPCLPVVAGIVAILLRPAAAAEPSIAGPNRLLLAIASYRDRPLYPTIFFYQIDSAGAGEIIDSIAVTGKRSDSHPALSRDARYCAFASEEENETSRILVWDRTQKQLVEHSQINDSPNAQLHPTSSGDGRLIVFAAWNRPGFSQRWDLFLYDTAVRTVSALADINTLEYDERMPVFSGDGRLLAYASNEPGSAGLTDIRLYQADDGAQLDLAAMNSAASDTEPALSDDGRWLAFVSDRPGGSGGRDIYVFDRQSENLLPLRGLNSVANEQTPSLSGDGRYLAFVSERISGAGERDVFLYDIQTQTLLATPDLNSPHEDMDPCVVYGR
jgi:Tol biopolymer transport system component